MSFEKLNYIFAFVSSRRVVVEVFNFKSRKVFAGDCVFRHVFDISCYKMKVNHDKQILFTDLCFIR